MISKGCHWIVTFRWTLAGTISQLTYRESRLDIKFEIERAAVQRWLTTDWRRGGNESGGGKRYFLSLPLSLFLTSSWSPSLCLRFNLSLRDSPSLSRSSLSKCVCRDREKPRTNVHLALTSERSMARRRGEEIPRVNERVRTRPMEPAGLGRWMLETCNQASRRSMLMVGKLAILFSKGS